MNVHASLLPRWRGAAPVQRAILAGDEITGVSIMRMEAGLDTGPYDDVAEVPVDELSAPDLTDALARAGAEALMRTLSRIEHGDVSWVSQDDTKATYAEKITRADVTPDPGDSVDVTLRKVRASSPQAASRVLVDGRGVTLVSAHRWSAAVSAGEASASAEGLELGVADGSVLVTRVKPDGKPEMDAAAWIRGARLADDARWEPQP